MRFFHGVWLPDASTVSRGWLDPAPEALPAIGCEGKFREPFKINEREYVLDGTAGGPVICSVWREEVLVTHAAVVAGVDRQEDAWILELLLRTTVQAPAIQELTAGVPEPFAELLTIQERPFCATVLLPLESWDETEALLEWQHRWVASHLEAILTYEE